MTCECVMDDPEDRVYSDVKEHEMTSKFSTLLLASIFFASGASAGESTHSIRVTLFGQPCLLEGPTSEAVLKTIHSISPEQVYPTFEPGGKSAKVKAALEKLRAGKDVPNGLDLYREQLTKRLEAQTAFLKALEESQQQKKAEPLLMGTKVFFSEAKYKSFETAAKRLESGLNASQRKEVLEQLFNSFGETLPSDPEEEFHKAIHRMKVQYICSFEPSDSGEGDESAD